MLMKLTSGVKSTKLFNYSTFYRVFNRCSFKTKNIFLNFTNSQEVKIKFGGTDSRTTKLTQEC